MVAGAGAVQSLAVLPGTALRLVAGAACLLLAWVARRWRKGAAGVLAVLAAGLLAGALIVFGGGRKCPGCGSREPHRMRASR